MRLPAASRWAAANPAWLLLAPLLIGAGLRLSHAWSCYDVYIPHVEAQEGYYEAGVGLLANKVFAQDMQGHTPTVWRGPLYPAFIASVESLFVHPSPGHVYLAQALLSTLAIAAAFGLGWLLVSPWAGFFAALLMALDVDQVAAVPTLNVHQFYSLCMLAVAAAAARWAEKPTPAKAAILGLCLGASLLCRSSHFLLPVLLAAAVWAWSRSPREALRRALPLAAFAALAIAPFMLRNALQFQRLVLFDVERGGYPLLTAAVGEAGPTTVEHAFAVAESLQPGFRRLYGPGSSASEQERQSALFSLAAGEIKSRPGRYLLGWPARWLFFWGPLWLLLLPAAAGLLLNPRNRGLQAVGLVAASFLGYAAVGISEEYRVTVLPVLCVLAGCGLGSLLSRRAIPAGRWTRWVAAVYPAGLALIYAALLAFLAQEFWLYGWPVRQPEAGAQALDRRVVEVLERATVTGGAVWVDPAYSMNYALQLGDRWRAKAAVDRVVNASRGAPPYARAAALIERARVETRYGDAEAARRDLEDALQLVPEDLAVLTMLSESWLARGDARRALPYADRLIEAARTAPAEASSDAYLLRARIRRLMGPRAAPLVEADLARALSAGGDSLPVLAAVTQEMRAPGDERRALSAADRLVAASAGLSAGERVRALVSRARLRIAANEFPEAQKDLDDALKVSSNESLPALREMSRLWTARERPRAALAFADRVVKAGRGGPAKELSEAYVERARILLRLGSQAQARRDLDAALALDPRSLGALRSLAEEAGLRGRGAQALAYADRMVAAAASTAAEQRVQAFVARARVRLDLKDYGRAREDFGQALKEEPKNRAAIDGMAQAWLADGRRDKALDYADRLVAAGAGLSERDRAAALAERGKLRSAAGDSSGGRADFEAALRLDAGNRSAIEGAAHYWIGAGDPGKAVAYVDRMSAGNGAVSAERRARVLLERGRLRLELKENDKARKDFEEALTLEAGNRYALRSLSRLAFSVGREDQALAYAQRLTRLDDRAEAAEKAGDFVALARLEAKGGMDSDAERDLRRASELDASLTQAPLALAESLCRQGRTREALDLLARGGRALDSASAAPRAQWLIARSLLREAAGQAENARLDREAALRADADAACRQAPELLDRSRAGLAYFDACLARFPEDPKLRLDRGVARYTARDVDGSMADLREAVRLKPDFLEASVSLATALRGAKKLREARAEIGRAVAAAPRRKGEPVYREALTLRAALDREAAGL